MTDNEIIKAFKDFLIEQVDGYTDHVETGGERYEFIEKELELLKETDNLINRQQAQLFKERNKNSKLRNERNRLKAEVERLKANNKTLENVVKNTFIKKAGFDVDLLVEIKAEAIKEFAERLKDKHRRIMDYDEAGFGAQIFIFEERVIDNLLKEMVGDNQ